MSTIMLEAEARNDLGKAYNRRLRHSKRVPAVIYGGDAKPVSVSLSENKVMLAFQDEAIFSSVVTVSFNGTKETVIIKELQRHPFKPLIMHIDLQRVSAKDTLVKEIPLHFINEDKAKGVKAGGIISHTMVQIEVKCMVKDLPQFIEVDLIDVDLDQTLHLSDIKLPKKVALTADLNDGLHDLPVVSIHLPKVVAVEEEESAEADMDTESEEAEDNNQDNA